MSGRMDTGPCHVADIVTQGDTGEIHAAAMCGYREDGTVAGIKSKLCPSEKIPFYIGLTFDHEEARSVRVSYVN